MATLQRTQPSARFASPRPGRVRGHLLLAASMAAWAGTMAITWQLSEGPVLQLAPWVVAGGLLAGAIGAVRTLPDRLPKDEGWVLFKLLSCFATSGAWIFIVEELSRNQEFDDRWLNALLGYVIYSVARDMFMTLCMATFARIEARRQEELRQEQRARVHAIAIARAKLERERQAVA